MESPAGSPAVSIPQFKSNARASLPKLSPVHEADGADASSSPAALPNLETDGCQHNTSRMPASLGTTDLDIGHSDNRSSGLSYSQTCSPSKDPLAFAAHPSSGRLLTGHHSSNHGCQGTNSQFIAASVPATSSFWASDTHMVVADSGDSEDRISLDRASIEMSGEASGVSSCSSGDEASPRCVRNLQPARRTSVGDKFRHKGAAGPGLQCAGPRALPESAHGSLEQGKTWGGGAAPGRSSQCVANGAQPPNTALASTRSSFSNRAFSAGPGSSQSLVLEAGAGPEQHMERTSCGSDPGEVSDFPARQCFSASAQMSSDAENRPRKGELARVLGDTSALPAESASVKTAPCAPGVKAIGAEKEEDRGRRGRQEGEQDREMGEGEARQQHEGQRVEMSVGRWGRGSREGEERGREYVAAGKKRKVVDALRSLVKLGRDSNWPAGTPERVTPVKEGSRPSIQGANSGDASQRVGGKRRNLVDLFTKRQVIAPAPSCAGALGCCPCDEACGVHSGCAVLMQQPSTVSPASPVLVSQAEAQSMLVVAGEIWPPQHPCQGTVEAPAPALTNGVPTPVTLANSSMQTSPAAAGIAAASRGQSSRASGAHPAVGAASSGGVGVPEASGIEAERQSPAKSRDCRSAATSLNAGGWVGDASSPLSADAEGTRVQSQRQTRKAGCLSKSIAGWTAGSSAVQDSLGVARNWLPRAEEAADVLLALLVLVALCFLFLGKVPAIVATLAVALLASRVMPVQGTPREAVNLQRADASDAVISLQEIPHTGIAGPRPSEAGDARGVPAAAGVAVDSMRKRQQQIAHIMQYSKASSDPRSRMFLEGLLSRPGRFKSKR